LRVDLRSRGPARRAPTPPACRRPVQSIPPSARRVARRPRGRRGLAYSASHTTGPPMNAPTPASPTPRQRWQSFMKTAEQVFHAYGNWLVSITWKRFTLLAVMLIIGANILQTLPPFSFSWQLPVETTETIHPPKDLRRDRDADRERREKERAADVEKKVAEARKKVEKATQPDESANAGSQA